MLGTATSTFIIRRDTESGKIVSHLRKNGPQYFEESDLAVDVQLVGEQQRRQCRIYRFELKAKNQVRHLRVKVPLHQEGRSEHELEYQRSDHRPRRFPPADPDTRYKAECTALEAIHDYFERLRDPRFGTVRLLDSLPEVRANVMEEVRNPSLRSLFARENRLQIYLMAAHSDKAFSNAGAWLRAYHSLPKIAPARHTRRSEFIGLVKEFSDYLATRLGDAAFFETIATTTSTLATALLPERLPVGLAHGDYAMRNILVGQGGQVTVLDTLARWRTSIFEDISYFLANLKMVWPQVISQGLVYKLNRIERYERRFLSGYFGNDSVPIQIVRVYEIQATLERWSGIVGRFEQHTTGRPAAVAGLQRLLENRYFKRSLLALLQSIRVSN